MDRTRVAAAWAQRLRVPAEDFAGDAVTVREREGLDSVVVVALGEAWVAVCPPGLAQELRVLEPAVLVDADALASALAEVGCEPIGTADLWFNGSWNQTATAPTLQQPTHPATAAELDELRAACSEDDWTESGLESMPELWVAVDDDGRAAAAAGYADWGDLAHLGVMAAPASRGRGFADAAAARAVAEAIASGRLAQWRCRAGNAASARLARRLGFTRAGVQVAVRVFATD